MAQIDCAVAPYLCNKVSVVSDVKPRGISKEIHLRQLASTRDAEGNLDSPAIFRGRLSRSSKYICSVPVQKMPKKSVGRTVTEWWHCP